MATSKYLDPNYLESRNNELIQKDREAGLITPPTQEEIDVKGYDQAVFDAFALDPELIKNSYVQEAEEVGQHVFNSASELWNQETGGRQGEMPEDYIKNLDPVILNEFLFEYEPSKTLRLNKAGISEEGLKLDKARLVYEAGGLNEDIKKENLERYLKATNPDQPVSVMFASELGGDENKEFLEVLLGPDTFKDLNYDPVIFKIGDGKFQVVNKPGFDKGDLQFITREVPVILADAGFAAGGTAAAGLPGMIAGSAIGSFIGEGVVQGTTDAYLTYLEGGEYTFDDFMERMEQAAGTMGQQAAFSAIATPIFKKLFDGVLAASSKLGGKRLPRSLREAVGKDEIESGASRVSNIEIEKLNTELTKIYGDQAPQIKLTLAKYFGDEYLAGVESFLKKNPKQRKAFVDEARANQKEAMDAVSLYLDDAAQVKPEPGIPSIGELGETVVGGARKASDDALTIPTDSAAFEVGKLNMVLDAIEAGSKGQKIDSTFLDTIATRNRELFQTKKKELDLVISNTLSTLPGGANAPFIKTGLFRREMYQLNKALNQALVNADSGTIKLIKEILEQTSGKKVPGTPGIAPAKELTFQQAMATLNGLNRLIDDDYARLAGGAADSNTITKVAAELRNSLNTSLEKSLSPENYLKLNTALTDLSNLRKQYNNEAINKLFKVAPNKLGLEISDTAVLSTILKDERSARELLGILNDPTLTSQRDLVKNYIKKNYISEVTDNRAITDPGTLVKRTKKWLENNEALLDFFSPDEKKLFNNANQFMKSADLANKELATVQAALKESGIERLGQVDPFTVNQYLSKNPSMVDTLVKSLESVNNNLAKKTLQDIKTFYLAELKNQIIKPDDFTGMNFFSSSAINNIIKSPNRGIYESLFGMQFINKLDSAAKALAPYEAVIQQSFSMGPSQFEAALKNVFFGQLDRKRTLLRGLQNLFKLQGFRDIEIPLANVDEFFKRYKSHLNQPEWIRAAAGAGTQEPVVTGMSESGETTLGEDALNLGLTGAGMAYSTTTEYAIPAVQKILSNIMGGGGSTVIQPE
jgi:hypothetical protein